MSWGSKEHNEFVDSLIEDVEWEPLRDFLSQLYEHDDQQEQEIQNKDTE